MSQPVLSPDEMRQLRRLLGRANANIRWAKEPDPAAATAPGRAAFLRRFEDQVDPDRVLPPAEREKRAARARRAYFLKLAAKSAKARAQRKRLAGSDRDGGDRPVPPTASTARGRAARRKAAS